MTTPINDLFGDMIILYASEISVDTILPINSGSLRIPRIATIPIVPRVNIRRS